MTEPLLYEMYGIKDLTVAWEDEYLVGKERWHISNFKAIVWKPSGVSVGVPTREGKTMANYVKYSLEVPGIEISC